MAALVSRNPATGEILKEIPEMPVAELGSVIDSAYHAYTDEWRTKSAEQRAELFRCLETTLRREVESLAHLITQEVGKPIVQSRAEIEKCAQACAWFAANGPSLLADERIPTEASWSGVTYQPLGLILAIMPWNFPFWQVFRAAAPAMIAGNTMVLKHAENVPQCAARIERLFQDAQFPENAFRSLPITRQRAPLAHAHERIAAVTFTGSVSAGTEVAILSTSLLRKCVLELGGSDPYVILEDADVPKAARLCVESRMINNGQSCIAAKRFIAVAEILEEFTACVIREMNAFRCESPDRESCRLGPLARGDLRTQLHDQVERSVEAGAQLLLGGKLPPPETPGFYYPPTILTDVKPGNPAADEELFGPVAAILPARDEDHAIELANTSRFGLGAAVFSRDVRRGWDIARTRLEAGFCCVNDYVRSDPRLPFGGIRASGIGRELGRQGILEFTNIKTLVVRDT